MTFEEQYAAYRRKKRWYAGFFCALFAVCLAISWVTARFDPVTLFGGLPRTTLNSNRSGVGGFMAAKVEGVYEEGDKRVELEVVDTGGSAGLVSLAAWAAMGATAESETAERIERMKREGKRYVREEISKRPDGHNIYSVILADRFMVSAEGTGVNIDALKRAVNGLDLAKLEAMK